MGKQSGLLVVLGLVLLGLSATQAQFTHCTQFSDCFRFFEDPDCSTGKRQVCVDWLRLPGCVIPDMGMVSVCSGGFDIVSLVEAAPLCRMVTGGETLRVGIVADPAANNNANTGNNSDISILGSREPVRCEGIRSFCSISGGSDFRLTFHTSRCPGTTPKPTRAPTTTRRSCACTQWSMWGQCSGSCGPTARQTRSRSCNVACGTPALHDSRVCSSVHSVCPRDGGWGSWSDLSSCPVTCGGGNVVRTRSCTNPMPQGGGRDCPGEGIQNVPCAQNTCRSVPNPTGETGSQCRRRIRSTCRRFDRRTRERRNCFAQCRRRRG